jgi:hypothetical protein
MGGSLHLVIYLRYMYMYCPYSVIHIASGWRFVFEKLDISFSYIVLS